MFFESIKKVVTTVLDAVAEEYSLNGEIRIFDQVSGTYVTLWKSDK
jgi:hypothetical protein